MILVTGASGFLGTHLLLHLCSNPNANIRALYRNEQNKAYSIKLLQKLIVPKYLNHIDAIEWFKTDILDIPSLEVAFQNITHVYHCAAWVGNNTSDYSTMRKVNIRGTANVVNLSLYYSIQKLCHVSSIATLGRYEKNNLIDEEAPRDSENNRSTYSITKYGAEMEVWRASQEGLDTIIINPGVILGAGFFHTSSGMMFSKVLSNFKFYPPKHTGFVIVKDVVDAMVKGMTSTIKNERFIIVSENLSIKTVMTSIAEQFGKKPPKYKVNKYMLYLAWFIQLILSPFKKHKIKITKDTILMIDSKYTYDNKKSKDILGLHYTSIKDGISYIYKDYKKVNL